MVTASQRHSVVTASLLTPGGVRDRLGRHVLSLTLPVLLLIVSPQVAEAQQFFSDAQAGRFERVQSELQRRSAQLEARAASADISTVGLNAAAIGFYSTLSDVASDCISGALSLDHCRTLFAAAQNAASGNLNRADRLARQVLDSRPDYPKAQLIRARIRMGICTQGDRRCTEAIALLQRAIGLDSTLAVAYMDLGLLYQQLGRIQEAITTWEIATTQAQESITTKFAHLMLALLYSQEEQWRQAAEHALKARELGFAGLADELLTEIRRRGGAQSASQGQEESVAGRDDSESTPPSNDSDPDPNFMTGMIHGLTSPLRLFGLFDLRYVEKARRTDGYVFGLLVGSLMILSIGAGAFKGPSTKNG